MSITDIRIGLHSLCTIARLIGLILIGFITDMRIGLQSLCTIALIIIANFEEKFLNGFYMVLVFLFTKNLIMIAT